MSVAKDLKVFVKIVWSNVKKSLQKNKYEKEDRFLKKAAIALLIIGIGYGSVYSYRWYIAQREEKAQKIFTEAFGLFQKAQKDSKKWVDAEGAFEVAYQQNSSSYIAPFFKLFQAVAMVEQGKTAEAVPLMQEGISKLNADTPLATFYQIKLALIQMDAQDETMKQEGLMMLTSLASDVNNVARDAALYHLGNHYWNNNQLDKAREAWSQLSQEKGDNNGESLIQISAPFAEQVKQKLEQIQ